jgi:CTP synthase (UTP-ammonia lyase)
VIERERKGDYLGKTVPHLTDATHNWIERVAKIPVDKTNETPDLCIIELGGAVRDTLQTKDMTFLYFLKSLWVKRMCYD